jgi:alpha-glucosidase
MTSSEKSAHQVWIRPGRGPRGQQPPNDSRSVFSGPAWSPFPATSEAVASGHQHWYLHLFALEQPA